MRNKIATRPWQHVLEPLSGYLAVGAALAGASGSSYPEELYRSAFNFGPNLTSNRTVADLVCEILRHWPGEWTDRSDPLAVHEAKLLNLATDKAFHLLGWQPAWDFEETIAETVEWYRDSRSAQSPEDFGRLTRRQIAEYTTRARSLGVGWTEPPINR